MPKIFGIILALLVIGGTIILPAFHKVHCADSHATHNSSDCPICQVANTPVITSSSAMVPIAEYAVTENVDVPVLPFLPSLSCNSIQARAPPVA